MELPEIRQVKDVMQSLKKNKIIASWELPYENLLTRRSAALFFLTATSPENFDKIKQKLNQFDNSSIVKNEISTLSKLDYLVTFKKETQND